MVNSLECAIHVDHLWKVFTSDRKFRFDENDVDKYITNGAIAAVRDVNLRIKRGELFVIMGLSGSGKSTLIRCLSRLIEPSYGKILINGKDVVNMNSQELTEFRRTEVAMVFQHYGLLPHRTILDNVSFGLKLRGVEAKKRQIKAKEIIEKVGLQGWEQHYPAQLSGGMQQRVGIARALVQDTDLLLMDEPFSGLDPLTRREMQDELVRLQNEYHKTIIFVTHDIAEALRLGDRMVVMRTGELVQEGRPKDIILNPVDEYVQRFVESEQQKLLPPESRDKKSNVRILEPYLGNKAERAKVMVGR
jgi:glycine betaine/proline transport system ATP-binding protein